jgi:anaerobic selenocysteine-containing dehydrogenase
VPWKNLDELFTERLQRCGLSFKELSQRTWALAPKDHPSGSCGYRRHEKGLLRPDGKPGFRTQSGKVELYSLALASYGLDPLPTHIEQIESPVSTPDLYKEYPLILVTGTRMPTMFHSEHRQIPWLRHFEQDPVVEIHPNTAKELGIEQGQWVWIEGVRGRCRRKAVITPVVHPKTVMAPHGWWLPEADGKAPYFYGVFDINVNLLIPMGCQGKSGFGGAPLKTMLCKVYPLDQADKPVGPK